MIKRFQAMCCQLHIAALIAEYLKLRGTHGWGAEAFAGISLNIPRDESGLKIDEGKYVGFIFVCSMKKMRAPLST